MGKIVLYHGNPDKIFTPTCGKGNDKHDYGKGFYLTERIDLAKEWAVCRPNEENGWVHKYELDCKNLKILDFQKLNVLTWLAELMKHRDAADSKRYRMLAAKFIEKYGVETEGYDVIKGWRANTSYFYIAKELWEYFKETEHYSLQQGKAMEGFMPDWIGEFYAYYQWYYNIPSAEVNQKINVDFLKKAYYGLHDLDLDLAVQKVGKV